MSEKQYFIPIIAPSKPGEYQAELSMRVPKFELDGLEPKSIEHGKSEEDTDKLHKGFVLSDVFQQDLTRICRTVCSALEDIGETKKYELNQMDFSVGVNAEGKIGLLEIFSLNAGAETSIKLSFTKKPPQE